MKKVLILSIISVLAISAFADLTSFRWINGAPTALLDEGGAAIGVGQASVLTYISTDNVINFDIGFTTNNGLQATYGNDTLVYSLANVGAFAGQLITPFMTESDTGDNYEGMYAYAVVFNKTIADYTADGAEPGDWFGVSTVVGGPLTDPDAPNTPLSMTPGIVQTQYQIVIPEPATLGMMGVASIGLFLARRKTQLKLYREDQLIKQSKKSVFLSGEHDSLGDGQFWDTFNA